MTSLELHLREPSIVEITTISLDIAKNVFQVHGVGSGGAVAVRRQLRRGEVLKFFGDLSACLVGTEACASAHFWARQIGALGHEVRLLPPAHVKPYQAAEAPDRMVTVTTLKAESIRAGIAILNIRLVVWILFFTTL
jgi:transposase